jgi:oligoribonuclease (3'-5' exoribonuclease)
MTVQFQAPKPHALFWIDIEATALSKKNDFSDVHPLELAVIVTDFDLEPMAGYEAVITPTAETVASLRRNPQALEMHRANGLVAALKGTTETVEEVEQNLIQMLKTKTALQPGEFMIAGSGVARYDYGLLDKWMPALTSWFAYYPFDIGVMRRTAKILSGGRQIVEPNTASYGDEKLHRARADVEAHLAEARQWQDWFRRAS